MTTKSIDYYLVVNWKDEKIRARKTKPDNVGPYEILMEADIEIEVPDVETPAISHKLEIPQPTVDRIAEEAVFDREYPDWAETVDTVLDGAKETDSDYELLGRAMEDTHGVPDPDEVLEYIRRRIADRR